MIKDCANRYFLSFVLKDTASHIVDIEPITKPALRESIGVDLVIKMFAALSTVEKVLAPNLRKIERKIERLQRRFSKTLKGGSRRELLCLRIAKLHCRLADKRKDFLHKLSTKLVSENRIVVLEDLNVSGMVKNHKLARAISRQGWSTFRTMCETKTSQYTDREFRAISRWEPTSQTCSSCGYRWGKLDLSVRTVICASCGEKHCRDINASRVIEQVGVGHTHDYGVEHGRETRPFPPSKRTVSDSKTTSVASCSETSTHKLGEQLCLF